MNLSKNIKITRVANSSAAATTTVTSSVLDMAGFDGVMYLALLGDNTSGTVLTLTAKENTANSTTVPTPTAITNAAATITSASATDTDNSVIFVDVFRPLKEFQFCVLTRATQNATVDGIIAIQYCAHNKPTVQDATVIASAFAVGS